MDKVELIEAGSPGKHYDRSAATHHQRRVTPTAGNNMEQVPVFLFTKAVCPSCSISSKRSISNNWNNTSAGAVWCVWLGMLPTRLCRQTAAQQSDPHGGAIAQPVPHNREQTADNGNEKLGDN